ncbi:hypothetical protein [Novipirellula artificiosorum]|uniref:Lipocalin-like domain-containing protein n=1 Tax=Novipirellula artificiosorum TaxID=2528016 RepID=A0A5C6DIQ6_9BACT|nr:hypothetical protein [Novipirellula artificiosorum]TWU34846.1 hypothetical protein Poly41_39890 [Novipirellula artificiosorum]
MKRFSILLAIAAIVTANTCVVASAEGIPDEIVKELDYLVGKWESEGNVGDKRQVWGFTCRWARTESKEKICLIGEFSYKTGDETKSGVTLIGWNAAKGCIEDRGFDALGGNATLLWKVESPTKWIGEISLVEKGETLNSVAELIKTNDSECVMKDKDKNGNVSKIVFRKVKQERKKKAKE